MVLSLTYLNWKFVPFDHLLQLPAPLPLETTNLISFCGSLIFCFL